MAGDWLKMDSSTPDKPEVLAITARMGWDDPDTTVGKLFRVWRWFDQHTVDGNAARVTGALLDRIAGVSGFSEAMQAEGWLIVSDAGLSLPKFDRHNGATAKARALTAKRVANHRASDESNADGNAGTVTPALARGREETEKKEETREKKKTPRAAVSVVDSSVLVAVGFDQETANEFIAYKARMKAPLTERAWADHQSEAAKAGWTVVMAAEKVMAKSWKGFESKYVASQSQQARSPPPTTEQARAEKAEGIRRLVYGDQQRNETEFIDV